MSAYRNEVYADRTEVCADRNGVSAQNHDTDVPAPAAELNLEPQPQGPQEYTDITNSLEGGDSDWLSSAIANNDAEELDPTDDLIQQAPAVSFRRFMSRHTEYSNGLPEHVPSVAGQNATEMLTVPDNDAYTYKSSRNVAAEVTGVGAIQQTLNPPIEMHHTNRQRDSVQAQLGTVAGCTCRSCTSTWRGRIITVFKYCVDDKQATHTPIKVCGVAGCDASHGTLRWPETEHLFGPQGCSDKNVRCRCAAQGCRFFCVRWSDLRRHHAVKHCADPKRFPCPEFMCLYGGENGFKRLDKLKSHYKKVHEGKPKPNQTLRPIQPATTKPAAKEGQDGAT